MNQSNQSASSRKGKSIEQQISSDFGMNRQTGRKKKKWSPLRGLLRRTYDGEELDEESRILY